MEVKLIAMTDAMWEGKPAGSLASPEQVCNHSAKTCTSEDAGTMVGTWYVDDEPVPVWNDLEMKPLMAALKSGHESVLEHAVFTFEVKGVSRALTHQLVRHRMASYAQQSQRYVKMDDLDYIIPKSVTDAIECELMNGGGWNPNGCLQDAIKEFDWCLKNVAERMRKLGVPEEDIRYLYPQGITTNIIVTMNARELHHFFALRCCNRAQWEIRELAEKMLELMKEVAPTIFENAGPSCEQLGYCPEKRSCGQIMKLSDMIDIVDGIEEESSIRDEQRTAERECHR